MKTLSYFKDEGKVFYEKMSNGLDVYVIPNNNCNNYHVELVVKYGSSVKEFIPIGERDYMKLPLGVAHFLEHKMFDTEEGDAFSFYSKTGTYINAGTNFFSTRYYMDGSKCFKKNMDYLLSLVYTPYFKEDSVNREKGIIEEEIKMYDDEVDWELDHESKKSLFYTTVNEKIAGTKESIKLINTDILNKTFNTFYQPSNMFLIATGHVNQKEIIDIIKNNAAINKVKTNQEIIIKKEKEPVTVKEEYHLVPASIVIPKLSYSFKFDLDTLGKEKIVNKLYLNLLFTYLFGDTSKFYEKVSENKIAVDFFVDHLSFDNIYAITIEAESEYADLFKDEVDSTISKIDINEEEFERIKKVWLSVIIRCLDNKEALAHSIVEDILKDGKVSDQEELINKINYQELLNIVSKVDFNNKSFILMVPKENS